MSEEILLSLKDIAFAYSGRAPLFSGLSFDIRQGDRIGLHGPNGSGKTTLLRLMMGLEKPERGNIFFHGRTVDSEEELRRLRCGTGYVLQNSDEQLFSPIVLEELAFGPLNLGMTRKQAMSRAMGTLESLGMEALADRQTHRLSGGEKKMVAMASVLAMKPEAMLLDEPTAFLDEASRRKMIAILQALPLAMLIVSHDRDFLERTASSFVTIQGGRLVSRPL